MRKLWVTGKELDTYKVGTTANSTSTMHTIMRKPFERDMFAYDKEFPLSVEMLDEDIAVLNNLRDHYRVLKAEKEHKEAKQVWRVLIQRLPSSFKQTRTWSANYESLYHIMAQRGGHKLIEWHMWIDQVLALVEHPELLTAEVKKKDCTINDAITTVAVNWNTLEKKEKELLAKIIGGKQA